MLWVGLPQMKWDKVQQPFTWKLLWMAYMWARLRPGLTLSHPTTPR